MSFFDEDDEPARTTTRRQPRSQPRPRRGSPAGGGGGRGGTDQQTLLIRRILGGLAIVVVILVLGLVVKSCNSSRHKTALEDYNRQVNNIGAACDAKQKPDDALDYYTPALALWRQLGNRAGEAEQAPLADHAHAV